MKSRRRSQLARTLFGLGVFASVLVLVATQNMTAAGALETGVGTSGPPQIRWQYLAPIEMPSPITTKLEDVVLGPAVFTHARIDLGDLRLYDQTNHAVPYALRVLRSRYHREAFPAKEFNRGQGPEKSSELTLDLKRDNIEHNEVEITTPGDNFRRKVEVSGSSDGKAWSILASTNLVTFQRGNTRLNGNTVSYPPSRYRHLRIRVFPDPIVDKGPVTIKKVAVVRKVEVLGEQLVRDGKLEPREPVRADGGAGSAWIIDLGGDNVPCDHIEVVIDDAEFVRNFHIESAGPADSHHRFARVTLDKQSVWRRRAGESKKPMTAKFQEVLASRLRIVVTDHSNPPLHIRSVKYSAPVRQVVFAKPASADTRLRLFFGNPKAEAPNYDFARSLPEELAAKPTRSKLGKCRVSPSFVPPPKPLTERWPWLIYVVLGIVSTLLALIIISLARRSIALHDRQAPSV